VNDDRVLVVHEGIRILGAPIYYIWAFCCHIINLLAYYPSVIRFHSYCSGIAGVMTISLLVLDASQRSALAVTRSLGAVPGWRVTTAESASAALAGQSVFSSAYFQYPSAEKEPQAFLRWIKALLAEQSFDLVIPTTEVVSQLLLMHAAEIPHLRLPFASYDQVMALANKHRLLELAQSLGMEVPAYQVFDSARDLDVERLSYPLVIKPCLSKIYTGDGWLATRVRVVESAQAFAAELAQSPYLLEHPFMLQAFVPGQGAGVFALYNQGQAQVFFAHQRLREKPPEGGISVLSASCAVPAALELQARQLLDANHWQGVAMVEFRVTPEGKAYLMEVNTRFWGSLQLAIDAGVDFPRLLVESSLGLPSVLPEKYRVGQRLRWCLGDLDSLYLYWRGAYSWRQKLARSAAFVLPGAGPTRHEVNRWGDLRPAWFELCLYLKALLGRGG
jgi:predicted ATP-grasp superfamily ATP-dependent carboligase